ncbi:hypothetical protein DPMN_081517 [Dreissena polymorpha]|uniref:Uncharacterized protein n=1 Tax=Dreissena polymorpha TaxID=45954 RepID=A0A9D3Y569_DREPO|nr:hypothetical protein DPMN_081517 [Dreissena polymorpha]
MPISCRPCFQQTRTILELVQDIIRTSVLRKFHEDWTINVTNRVLNAPPSSRNVFNHTEPFCKNLLTKFHEDLTINVASRVLTRKMPAPWQLYIIGANLLTKFYDNRTINVASRVLLRKNALPAGSHVFQTTGIIFKLNQDIIGTNVLTKFHDDRKINVASRVLTRKNALPPWDIIETYLLTEFYEDQTINVASRVLTRKMLTPHNARRTKGDHKSSPRAHCSQAISHIVTNYTLYNPQSVFEESENVLLLIVNIVNITP